MRHEIRLTNGAVKRVRIRPGTRLEVLIFGGGGFHIPRGRSSNPQVPLHLDDRMKEEPESDEAIARSEAVGLSSDSARGVPAPRGIETGIENPQHPSQRRQEPQPKE